MFDTDVSLFLVAPDGFEHLTCVIIALNVPDATSKAMLIEGIREAVNVHMADLRVMDLSKQFLSTGWEIFIARKGIYH